MNMTNPNRLFFFIAIAVTLISCKKESGEHASEEKIFTALLPDLIEAVYRDPEKYLNPPFSEEKNYHADDSMRKNPEVAPAADKELKTVSVFAMIEPVSAQDTATLNMLVKNNGLKIKTSTRQSAYKLNLKPFTDKRYHIKTHFESSLEENTTEPDGKRVYHVGVAFSRIQFDENEEAGILTGTYICQPRCGIGYVIIIRKTAAGWKIDKVFPTWVS
jgi:hypothetical protein